MNYRKKTKNGKYVFTILILLDISVIIPLSSKATEQGTIVVTSRTPDRTQTGLRIYKPKKSFGGYTLFTHMSLELPGTIRMTPIYLIDMEGNIIYQWMAPMPTFHAQLKPDGHLLYNITVDTGDLFKKGDLENSQIKNYGLRELDFQSNEIWHYPAFIEHDFQILDHGNILFEQEEQILEPPRSTHNGLIKGSRISPCIEIVTPDKEIIWKWRGDEHADELRALLGLQWDLKSDWAHNNTCRMLKNNLSGMKDPRFHEGNIIFSYSHLDLIGIIEFSTGKIVWAWGPGVLEGQHAPSMLDNGNILLFDNGLRRGWSRIIELNPLTKEIVWEYHSEPKEDFFSSELSNVAQLPNGNIFICEASKNRLFEITPQGEIVWDFISTFNKTTGEEGIFCAYRYSPEYVEPLLKQIETNIN